MNLTERYLDFGMGLVETFLVKSKNVFFRQFLARGAFVLLTPAYLITTAIDTITGLGASLATCITLGKVKSAKKFAKKNLQSTNLILSKPFYCLLKTINPGARITPKQDKETIKIESNNICENYTFARPKIIRPLINKAIDLTYSKNGFKKHVAARLLYVVILVTAIVTRILGGIVGVMAGALALLTAGKVSLFNRMAYQGLKIPGVIPDLHHCFLGIINPLK